MLAFSELSADGQDLELLTREILFKKGLAVNWSGRGPDGGRDLVCIERQQSIFVPVERRWLVQCKHNALSGRAVGITDLDNIVDSCQQHECTGYLLVCSTYPSSGVVQRLEAITANPSQKLVATYWDAVKIEQILSTPSNWALAQRFFPVSANGESWQIYATDRPNHWVVIYKGYYFQLFNRIGSQCEFHLESIKQRVVDIKQISLPNSHFLRIRAVYYDDKNGNYAWYLDYMYPHDENATMGTRQIARTLGDGYTLEDGQSYTFDVRQRSYMKFSDHYDPDHYDYYEDLPLFSHGVTRPRSRSAIEEEERSEKALLAAVEKERNRGYKALVRALNQVFFLRIVRSCNSTIEDLDRFHALRNWTALIEKLHLKTDRFFSAWFLLEVNDDVKFYRMMSFIPQSVERFFRLTRCCVYVRSHDLHGSTRKDSPDEFLYELTLEVHPATIIDKITGRSLLNSYFEDVVMAIEKFLEQDG